MGEFKSRLIDMDPPLIAADGNESDKRVIDYLAYLKENLNFIFTNLGRRIGGYDEDITEIAAIAQASAATANAALRRGIEYIEGTQTGQTNAWTGVSADDSLYEGKSIAYYLPFAGNASAATLNLTLAGGGTTGPVNVRINNSNVTTHYPQYTVIKMTYDGTYWKTDNYDSNTYDRVRHNSNVYAAEAITGARIIAGTSAGYKNISAGLAFDLAYPLLYASAAAASGTNTTSGYLVYPKISATANGAVQSGGARKMLFLKGTVSGGTFTIASSTYLTTVVPTADDGFYYIPLGIMHSGTAVTFVSSRNLFAYKNGAFQDASTSAVIKTPIYQTATVNFADTNWKYTGVSFTIPPNQQFCATIHAFYSTANPSSVCASKSSTDLSTGGMEFEFNVDSMNTRARGSFMGNSGANGLTYYVWAKAQAAGAMGISADGFYL